VKKTEKEKLEWFVYVEENFSSGKIEHYNIFEHSSFMDDLVKIKKKYKDDFDKFEEEVKHSLMYYFWSKCEWEIVLTSWPPYVEADEVDRLVEEKQKRISEGHHFYRENVRLSTETKIDVYDQIRLNWKKFINYLWTNQHLIKKVK